MWVFLANADVLCDKAAVTRYSVDIYFSQRTIRGLVSYHHTQRRSHSLSSTLIVLL